MEIVKKRRRLRERVVKRASKWAGQLPFAATVILVGSYARGDFNLWSDVDVLLISNSFKGNPVERLRSLNIPPGFQVIPLTLEEFKRLVKRESHIAVEALELGKVLREDIKLAS